MLPYPPLHIGRWPSADTSHSSSRSTVCLSIWLWDPGGWPLVGLYEQCNWLPCLLASGWVLREAEAGDRRSGGEWGHGCDPGFSLALSICKDWLHPYAKGHSSQLWPTSRVLHNLCWFPLPHPHLWRVPLWNFPHYHVWESSLCPSRPQQTTWSHMSLDAFSRLII